MNVTQSYIFANYIIMFSNWMYLQPAVNMLRRSKGPFQYNHRHSMYTNTHHRNRMTKQQAFLTRPAVNITANKIDIWRVRCYYSLLTWSRHNCLVIVTSSAIDCDVIRSTKTEQMRHGDDVLRSPFLSSFMNSLCRVRNKRIYVFSWRTVSALTRGLFWYWFPPLLRISDIPLWKHPPLIWLTVNRWWFNFDRKLYICIF